HNAHFVVLLWSKVLYLDDIRLYLALLQTLGNRLITS
ncbi:MAG: hypothetical protein ACI9QR_002165, partial [Flavobacteriaceae bacterium]